jgi:hypothetical protein
LGQPIAAPLWLVGWARARLVLAESDKKTNHDTEKGNTLDERSCQDNGTLNFARCFGLAGNSFCSRATNAANAKTGAKRNQTSTDTGTHHIKTS